MRYLPEQKNNPNLLVGHETSDDAGAYKVTDELALVQTLDYFTPIVDDPYMFGQIAAANALSDLYAMGATPKTALNIVGFPIKKLGAEILAQILKGAADKVAEADALIIGGHSIDDQEPKFGLSVTGFVHPNKIWKNIGATAGDVLVITKPLGVGVLTTGIKRDKTTLEQTKQVTAIMAQLNKLAADLLQKYTPSAVTDITGFGLLGHASEMARGSNVSMLIDYSKTPLLDGAHKLAQNGVIPGGSKANHKWLKQFVAYGTNITETEQLLLCDAITSGGLFISMPINEAKSYVEELHNNGLEDAAIIGRVIEKEDQFIYVQ